jgi:hypothetical protein
MNAHVVHRTAQAGPPHDGKASLGQRGHFAPHVHGSVQVSALLLTRWAEHFSLGNNPIEALLKNKKKCVHLNPLGQLKLLEEALLNYIFEQCKQGIEISTLSIVVVVSNLSTAFDRKDFAARCSTIIRQALSACSVACLSNGHARMPGQAQGS